MKRRLSPTSRRPKRMVVPSSEQEWLTGPVYEWDWDRLLDDTTSRTQRPLPSSTVLASFVPVDLPINSTRGFAMPLLQHLQLKGQVAETDDINEDIDVAEESGEAIDDAQSSTLTRGQHTRYQQLQSGDSWNEIRRKEFRRLDQRVKAEQDLYFKALEAFWEKHQNHFKVGLESPFARYCFAYTHKYQEQWHGSRYYGKCRQVVSLQHISRKALVAKKSNSSFTFDSINTKVVHICGEKEAPTVAVDWQTCSPVFAESNMPSPKLLQDDPLALDLAKEHNASIVTTEETLAALVKLSGWIPMSNHEGIVLLDLPLPHPTIPRECLSRGVTEGFYQSLSKQQHASSTIVYTLVTLTKPTTASRRILVRSNRRLQTNDKHKPLYIHVQLEYFPNRGWEEIPSYERALWIVENVLLDARVWIVRVCPSTMRSLQWEEMGIAHALAASGSTCSAVVPSIDPMTHWETMFEVLLVMETILEGNHLLRFEGSSISVHTASNDDRMIDIFEELSKAEAVYTGAVALRQCARMWRWNQERIPYTFPMKDDVAKNKR